jgi:hypothetical protein
LPLNTSEAWDIVNSQNFNTEKEASKFVENCSYVQAQNRMQEWYQEQDKLRNCELLKYKELKKNVAHRHGYPHHAIDIEACMIYELKNHILLTSMHEQDDLEKWCLDELRDEYEYRVAEEEDTRHQFNNM